MSNKKKLADYHRFIFFFISVIFLLNPIPHISQAQQLTASERDWLAHKGEIVFVSQSNYPPFEFIDKDRSRAGMCIELIRWISTEFGFQARFLDMNFEDAQQAILSGEADVLTSFFYSKKRDKQFDFTHKTWEVPALIFVKAERPDITDLKDLQGKRIAMQRGDYAKEFLRSKNIRCKLVYTNTFAEAVDKVVAGKADAVIGDKQIVLYYLFKNNLCKQIKSVGKALYIGQNCMAMCEGILPLQSILNKGVELAQKHGIFSTINRKWIGTYYNLQIPWYHRYLSVILLMLAVLVVLATGILFWNIQLRRIVFKKTNDLQQSEANLRTFLNTIPDMIWFKDPSGVYLSCNMRVERFLGAIESDIIGKKDNEFVDQKTADYRHVYDRMAISAGKPCKNEEEVIYADDGHKELLETIRLPMYDQNGKLLGVLGVARDITEKKATEDRIQEQKQLLETIINAIPGIICIKDGEGRWLVANNYVLNLFQIEGVDFHGKTDAELALFSDFYKDTFLARMDSDNIAWEKGRIFQGEETIPQPDGLSLVFDIAKIPLFYPDGSLHALVVVGHDITLRKKQELILQQMVEEQIRDISKKQNNLVQLYDELDQIFNAALPMAVIDRNLTFVRVNDTLCNYVGMKKEDLIGKYCYELYNAEYCFTKDCTLCQLQDGSAFVQREVDRCLPDGKHFVCTVRSSPFCDSDGKILGFICSFFDQYEKKMTEKELQKTRQQLIHADKLSAVGRLSASIAHEFNNPLFGVMNVLIGIKDRTNLVENDQRMIEMAIKECQRMKLLIRELKCFNRPSSGKKVLFDLHHSIDEILLFHKNDLKMRKINIVKEYDPDLPKIWAVEDQIKQVFINLINNAAAALEDKSGTVIIATRLKADSAMISITDTGVGIRLDHKDHIFEPFFSTKKQVKGTGLGLSVSYGIIKSHGGDIVVDSKPGMGATFTIILPINSAFHKDDEKS